MSLRTSLIVIQAAIKYLKNYFGAKTHWLSGVYQYLSFKYCHFEKKETEVLILNGRK